MPTNEAISGQSRTQAREYRRRHRELVKQAGKKNRPSRPFPGATPKSGNPTDVQRASQAGRSSTARYGSRQTTRTSQGPMPPGLPGKKAPMGGRSRTALNLLLNPRTDRDRARNAARSARHAVHVKNEPGRFLPKPHLPPKPQLPNHPKETQAYKRTDPRHPLNKNKPKPAYHPKETQAYSRTDPRHPLNKNKRRKPGLTPHAITGTMPFR